MRKKVKKAATAESSTMDALSVHGPENAVRACDLDGAKRFDYLSVREAYGEDNDEYRAVAALCRLFNAEQMSRCATTRPPRRMARSAKLSSLNAAVWRKSTRATRGVARALGIATPQAHTANVRRPMAPTHECVSGFPPDRVRPRPVCFRRRPYSRPALPPPGRPHLLVVNMGGGYVNTAALATTTRTQ
jgi:hypothetical protein